jgi:hypothetical protein
VAKRKIASLFLSLFSFRFLTLDGDAPCLRRRIGKENHARHVSINSSIKNHWYEPARDIIDCLFVLRFACERHHRLPLRAALRCTLRYPNKSCGNVTKVRSRDNHQRRSGNVEQVTRSKSKSKFISQPQNLFFCD